MVGLSLLLLLSPGLGTCGTLPGERSLDYADPRTYFVQASSRTKPTAGLVVLHGAQYEADLEAGVTTYFFPLFQGAADEDAVLVVFPQGKRGRCPWDKGLVCWPMHHPWEDVRFLNDIVRELGREYGIADWTVLGFSNGGYYLASVIQSGEELPFARAIIDSGGNAWDFPVRFRWTPSLKILSGSRDAQNPGAGKRLFERLRREGYEKSAALSFEEFDGGHEIPKSRIGTLIHEALKASRTPPRR